MIHVDLTSFACARCPWTLPVGLNDVAAEEAIRAHVDSHGHIVALSERDYLNNDRIALWNDAERASMESAETAEQKLLAYVGGLEKTITDAEDAAHAHGYELATWYLADIINDQAQKIAKLLSTAPNSTQARDAVPVPTDNT